MGKETSKDLFLNFASLMLNIGAPSTVLVTALLNTGMSIRGALGWLVHQIQWWITDDMDSQVPNALWGVLGTRPALAVMPAPEDDGVIDAAYLVWGFAAPATGAFGAELGRPRAFNPPIPLASPSVTLYGSSMAADANLQGNKMVVRLGYTTTPMDAALWQEIAETWGW